VCRPIVWLSNSIVFILFALIPNPACCPDSYNACSLFCNLPLSALAWIDVIFEPDNVDHYLYPNSSTPVFSNAWLKLEMHDDVIVVDRGAALRHLAISDIHRVCGVSFLSSQMCESRSPAEKSTRSPPAFVGLLGVTL